MCIKEQQPRADQNTQHVLDKQHTRAGQNIQPSTKSEKLINIKEVNIKRNARANNNHL